MICIELEFQIQTLAFVFIAVYVTCTIIEITADQGENQDQRWAGLVRCQSQRTIELDADSISGKMTKQVRSFFEDVSRRCTVDGGNSKRRQPNSKPVLVSSPAVDATDQTSLRRHRPPPQIPNSKPNSEFQARSKPPSTSCLAPSAPSCCRPCKFQIPSPVVLSAPAADAIRRCKFRIPSCHRCLATNYEFHVDHRPPSP